MATFELEFGTVEVTVTAGIPGPPGAAGSGAPTDATYLTATAHASLSAEVVVGATPGGELGGTWASPTVDATHSGSSHASVQAAAEATAAGALATHVAASDPHPVYLTAAEGAAAYDATGAAAAAQAAAVQRANHTGTQAESTVTNLVTDLAAKAPLASPALTGTPTAPTPTASDNSTKLATTAYVDTADALKAPLASPALTGNPTAPTQSAGNNSTRLATTAYTDAADALKANLASPTFTGSPVVPGYLPLLAGGAAVENIGAVESNVETASVTGTKTADLSVYGVFDYTMTGNTTFTFSNPAPSGKNTTFVLYLRGAFTPTLPASVKWSGGSVPTYTTYGVYVLSTVNGGTSYEASQVGRAFA